MVIKFGGNVMGDAELTQSFARDVVLLRSVGICPLVVHGGGPQIKQHLDRLGIPPSLLTGIALLTRATLEVVRMVLVGQVNREIVAAMNLFGEYAVGMSGEDARLLTARQRDPALGFVGDVSGVNTKVLNQLLADGIIPVIASIGADDTGQAYNINADLVAGAVAAAMAAEKLIVLTDGTACWLMWPTRLAAFPKCRPLNCRPWLARGRSAPACCPSWRPACWPPRAVLPRRT